MCVCKSFYFQTAKFEGGEYLNESCNVCLLLLVPLLNAENKHVLTHFALGAGAAGQ